MPNLIKPRVKTLSATGVVKPIGQRFSRDDRSVHPVRRKYDKARNGGTRIKAPQMEISHTLCFA